MRQQKSFLHIYCRVRRLKNYIKLTDFCVLSYGYIHLVVRHGCVSWRDSIRCDEVLQEQGKGEVKWCLGCSEVGCRLSTHHAPRLKFPSTFSQVDSEPKTTCCDLSKSACKYATSTAAVIRPSGF